MLKLNVLGDTKFALSVAGDFKIKAQRVQSGFRDSNNKSCLEKVILGKKKYGDNN